MEAFDRKLLLWGLANWLVGAQDLKSERLWFHSTPSGFRCVHGYKFRIEFDGQGHVVLLQSLSAHLSVKQKLQKCCRRVKRLDFQDYRHDHGAAAGGLLDQPLQFAADFVLDHAVVGLLLKAQAVKGFEDEFLGLIGDV